MWRSWRGAASPGWRWSQPCTPSPTWKRVLAWVLFAIVVLGIASWLLNIAVPEWPEKLFGYTRG